jgi:hypothetical protein
MVAINSAENKDATQLTRVNMVHLNCQKPYAKSPLIMEVDCAVPDSN